MVAPRIFTAESATRLLVHAEPIVADMVREYAAMEAAEAALRELQPESTRAESQTKIRSLKLDMEYAERRYREAMRELISLGVEVRDPEKGRIDFPALVEGEPAFLCWCPQDDRVWLWHRPGEERSHSRPLPRADEPGGTR